MYKGSCLCGAVKFQISSGLRNIVYCHCSECRKAQGSAFAANGIVEKNNFKIISGGEQLSGYESTPDQTKYFCRHCGSPIMSKNLNKPDQLRVRLGTIESDLAEKPGAHIFVSSKANWDNITDDLPQYDAWEPDR